MRVRPLGIRKEEEDDSQRHGPKRKINLKAPSPRRAVRERTSKDRSHDGCDAKHGGERRNVNSPFPQRHRKPNDGHAARIQRCSPRARDCPADDEHGRTRRRSAYNAANLEYYEREEIRVFDVEVGVYLAEGGLQRGCC
jgi:hypothetical protein